MSETGRREEALLEDAARVVGEPVGQAGDRGAGDADGDGVAATAPGVPVGRGGRVVELVVLAIVPGVREGDGAGRGECCPARMGCGSRAVHGTSRRNDPGQVGAGCRQSEGVGATAGGRRVVDVVVAREHRLEGLGVGDELVVVVLGFVAGVVFRDRVVDRRAADGGDEEKEQKPTEQSCEHGGPRP